MSDLLKVVFFVIIGFLVLGAVGLGLGWFDEATEVAQKEFGPKKALEKYEWFKEQAASIKKANEDVAMAEKRVGDIDRQYANYGANQASWPPDVRVQYNSAIQQARDDRFAIVSQRNNLVRDYNAASSKFNWSPFQTDPNKPDDSFQEYVIK